MRGQIDEMSVLEVISPLVGVTPWPFLPFQIEALKREVCEFRTCARLNLEEDFGAMEHRRDLTCRGTHAFGNK